MNRICRLIIAAFVCCSAVCCTKPVVRCDYRLIVTWQERKAEKEPQLLSTAKAYAFFADPQQWEVTSVEDARDGIITSVNDSSQRQTYDMEGFASGEGLNVFSFEFDTRPVMLVVADMKYPMWATGNANVVPDLRNMYVTLNFTPLDWKEGTPLPVVKNPWKFYGYDQVKIPIDSEMEIVASVTPRGSVASSRLESARCFAFYGISKGQGRVTSWEQAMSGIAEKLVERPEGEAGEDIEDEYEEVRYDVRGEARGDTLVMKITDPKVMIVVYNQVESQADTKMYAYGFFDFTDNPYSKNSPVSFDLNKSNDSWFSDPWNIVLERPRVVE